MDRNNVFPNIHPSLVGCVIMCLKQITDQPWVRVGMKLTVTNVTKSGKFQFKELKWAWGGPDNAGVKYFRVLQFPQQADEKIMTLKSRIKTGNNMNLDSLMSALDEIIDFEENKDGKVSQTF